MPFGSTTRGRLLVATPPLDDPNFDRTVVLMLDHSDVGAVGVVLNRPGDDDIQIADEHLGPLAEWVTMLAPPSTIFVGGPVADDSLVAIAAGTGQVAEAWGLVSSSVGTVDLSLSPSEVADAIHRVRIFRGYAGWGPGQLEAELAAGGWMVFEANDDDVFTSTPDDLWRRVVRRQGGRLTWIADAPDDLSAN